MWHGSSLLSSDSSDGCYCISKFNKFWTTKECDILKKKNSSTSCKTFFSSAFHPSPLPHKKRANTSYATKKREKKRGLEVVSRFSRGDQFQNDIFGTLLFFSFFFGWICLLFFRFLLHSFLLVFFFLSSEGVNSSFVFYFHSPWKVKFILTQKLKKNHNFNGHVLGIYSKKFSDETCSILCFFCCLFSGLWFSFLYYL